MEAGVGASSGEAIAAARAGGVGAVIDGHKIEIEAREYENWAKKVEVIGPTELHMYWDFAE